MEPFSFLSSLTVLISLGTVLQGTFAYKLIESFADENGIVTDSRNQVDQKSANHPTTNTLLYALLEPVHRESGSLNNDHILDGTIKSSNMDGQTLEREPQNVVAITAHLPYPRMRRSLEKYVDEEMKQLDATVRKLKILQSTRDEQVLLLVKQYYGKLQHILRRLAPTFSEEKISDIDEILNSFIKRKFNSWGGKRSSFSSWGGKRNFPSSNLGGKRYAFNSWGGKRSEFNSWGGKRSGFNSWGGKRSGFNSWGGKRSGFNSWGGKRSGFNSWGGKRSGLNSWGGKRSEFNNLDNKRSGFNSWGGKRSELNSLVEQRGGFNSWGGKRSGTLLSDLTGTSYDNNQPIRLWKTLSSSYPMKDNVLEINELQSQPTDSRAGPEDKLDYNTVTYAVPSSNTPGGEIVDILDKINYGSSPAVMKRGFHPWGGK